VAMTDGRLFFLGQLPGRKMEAKTWDGKTKYKTGETEEEERSRLAQWDKWLEEDPEGGEEKKE